MTARLIDTIGEWKSKRLSNEKIKSPITAAHHSPSVNWDGWINKKKKLKFKGRCIKEDKVNFIPRNLFIAY